MTSSRRPEIAPRARPRRRALLVCFLLAAAALPAAAAQEALPELVFEAPPELAGEVRRLQDMDRRRLVGAARLAGLGDPGPPVRVILVPESSPVARRVPAWVAGFARGADAPVVLFPARAGAYPYDSLEELLQHEVAHVLIDRAAGGHPVPRWLHEGIAMTAGERWGLNDTGRFAFEVARAGRYPLRDIDRLFSGSDADVKRAYAISGAFVHDLLRHHGSDVTARLLAGLRRGRPFEAAFRDAVGEPLASVEASFWRRQTLWNRWVPLLTSSTVLWIGVTLLFLVAWRRRAARTAELEERWEEMEESQRRPRRTWRAPAAAPDADTVTTTHPEDPSWREIN